jgi:demethylmacrocin O-methyltransferase
MKTELCELFEKYYSDKCTKFRKHSYSPIYYEILKDHKESFKDIIEIGVGNKELMCKHIGPGYQIGASLKAWRDFFINANVYGLDIRRDVLFSEDRLDCFYTDQSSEVELENTINNIRKYRNDEDLSFDLIVDDGSHIMDHVSTSFNYLSKYLRIGGFYIIEDIPVRRIELLREILNEKEFSLEKIYKGTFLKNYGEVLAGNDSFLVYKKVI